MQTKRYENKIEREKQSERMKLWWEKRKNNFNKN